VSADLDFAQDAEHWPNREASRFVEAAGFRWHVQVMGAGPVVLLIHGTGASSHSYGELAKILANTFTVVVPDLPGHGFTELPSASRLSLPAMAADLADLLKALKLEPSLVVGHSAGAAILIEMCLDRLIAPDAIISLNGALLPFGSVVGQFFSPLAKLLVLNPFVPRFFTWRASSPGAVERLIGNTGSRLDPQGIASYTRLFQNERHVTAALGMMAKWDLSRLENRLGDLRVPLVLVVGSEDRAVSPQDAFKIRDRVPGAKVVLLRGLGHLAHEERPEEVAEIVAQSVRSDAMAEALC
jgi:magnesium chelatase accessory protein